MKKLGWILLIISACFLLQDALCVLIPLAGVIVGWLIIRNSKKSNNDDNRNITITY